MSWTRCLFTPEDIQKRLKYEEMCNNNKLPESDNLVIPND